MSFIYLDVDVAVQVPVNTFPLIDDFDFKTREVSIVYNQSGMDLVWNFVTPSGTVTQTAVIPTTSGDYDWAILGDGMYKIEIPASGGVSINNDTEGYGFFTGICDGVLPWRSPTFCFRSATLNDSLIEGNDLLDVNTKQLAGTEQSATDLKDFADDGYDPATNKVQGVVLVDTLTTYTGNTPQTADNNIILTTINGKLPTNYIMGSSVQSNKDDEIDAIKAITDNLPNSGALTDIDTGINNLESRLTALRAGYLDNLSSGPTALASVCTEARLAELDAGNLIADVANVKVDTAGIKLVTDNLPDSGSLSTIDTGINNLEARLTAVRAGYLDNLSAGPVALASVATEARLAELDAANLIADVANVKSDTAAIKIVSDNLPNSGALTDIDTGINNLEARLTALRAGYLDNLSAGAVALASVATEARLAELDGANLPTDVSLVQTDVTAIKAQTDDLPSGIQKGKKLDNFQFYMALDSDGYSPATGKTITGNIVQDNGAIVSLTNSVVEIGNGLYRINLTASEMNADTITLLFANVDCRTRKITFVTSL